MPKVTAPIKTRDLKVEKIKVSNLVPYARNARTHSPEQVDVIAASITEFGWTNPVLHDGKGGLIAGHGRRLAAIKLGLAEVPAISLKGLTKTQIKALVISDNQIALRGGWDELLLRSETLELKLEGFALPTLGFDADALTALLTGKTAEGLTDPDEAPEPPVEPVSRLGDVWLLGDHRLICGDATDKATVEKLLGADRPHLMVTDPPYGVNYDPDWRNRASRNGSLVNTIGATAIGKVMNDDRADWRDAWNLFLGDVAYVWHAGNKGHVVAESLLSAGFNIRAQIVWAKDRLIISRGHYHPRHEPLFYAVREGSSGHWSGDRKQSTLWEIAHRASETGHSTQKPVECMRRPIINNSKPGEAVYEPFSGSGTTIIAAEMTGRRCLAVELSEAYVDTGIIRWQQFTGKVAHLDATGSTFAETAAQRTEKPASASKAKAGRKGPAQEKAAVAA